MLDLLEENIYRTKMSLEFAKHLRKHMTPQEVRLWGRLRGGKFGARFHRQEPIGKYVADFACRSAWLIIEVDGEQHSHSSNDLVRDSWLRSQGWKVMRFTNMQIQWDLNECCNSIELVMADRLLMDIKPASRRYLLPSREAVTK